MSQYEVVIGLEIHVHLDTQSKLFCSCPNSFGDAANANVCEVCAGMPGVLPVLNKKAVEYAGKMALATHSTINKDSVFARKNYFYPDMPKNYQITQLENPFCENGWLDINLDNTTRRIGITRIQLEDDAGKNIHSTTENQSFVDLNRAGTPLIEIVSEPDLRSSQEAVAYLKKVHAIVVNLGISNGNMEEGSFRCDANVSLRLKGAAEYGTRAELKNLNSFRFVQKAIEYEISRQEDILDDGACVVQETRLYDSNRNITQSMRSKENAQDYRYFPDPDLLPILLTDEQIAKWQDSMPELPDSRKARFCNEWNIPEQEAELIAYDPHLSRLLQESVKIYKEPKKIANLILGPLLREMNQANLESAELKIQAKALAQLAKIIDNGLISAKIGADIFPDLMDGESMPEDVVNAKGLAQVSDTGPIEIAIQKIINENPTEVEAYRAGKTKLMGFFVGQVMREMKGKANPTMLNTLLQKHLDK